MAKKIIIEGDDKDELVAQLTEWLEMLGAEAPAGGEDGGEDLTGDGDGDGKPEGGEDEPTAEDLQAKIKPMFVKLAKTGKAGNDKLKAALKKVNAAKLTDIDDVDDLKKLAKLLGVKLD